MQVRLLLGPAGSGKTFRCLAEARAALAAAVQGPPLVFLAPKQATFQLERQLLSEPSLPGCTRLQILSFERLAERILAELQAPPPPLLAEEGRQMVLRALLGQQREQLRVFHATARLPGFAQQVSATLRELQQHGLSPARLDALAAALRGSYRLADKLRDLAGLWRAYLAWLQAHQVLDATCLLDLATAALQAPGHGPAQVDQGSLKAGLQVVAAPEIRFGGLWLDGFAEMTPQELDLLAALAPRCERATLAFCMESEPPGQAPWLSLWSLVSSTCQRLRERLAGVPGVEIVVEQLPRAAPRSRFAASPTLAHLEQHWAAPPGDVDGREAERQSSAGERAGTPALRQSSAGVRLVACSNPEAEAVLAAREVLRLVRGQGGRFREVAVIVRSLAGYDELLRRVFTRYEIPFFLDRREPVTHHPLAELTRYALRTVAFGWRHDDWFGTLKTGLVDADEAAIDRLENEALARGWRGRTWLAPLSLPAEAAWAARLERLRRRVAPPFKRLARRLGAGAAAEGAADLFFSAATGQPTGAELAHALRALWADLGVEAQLIKWTEAAPDSRKAQSQSQKSRIHSTVWEQLNAWLDNLELAFATEAVPLGQWLPILETGLASLTVGVVPLALDQVLIGAVDRARNPELRLALVLGLNEGVFPAPPPLPQLLTEADRETLAERGAELGPDRRRLLARELYLGYIACTRSAQELVLTYALRGAKDEPLNPSPFVTRLQRLFPALGVETWPPAPPWNECEHTCELNASLIRALLAGPAGASLEALAARPGLAWLGQAQDRLRIVDPKETLAPAVAERLYGPEVLETSVSRLERFAACPFRFFVDSGLGAEERRRFEVDWRQRGSFQHEVLARFHQQLRREGKAWRDVTAEEARERIGQLAGEVTRDFSNGLFQADDQSLFTAQSLTRALQEFIATVIVWMRSAYQFNPSAVELSFGGVGPGLPAWELDLGAGHRMAFRGIIDRVDLAPSPEAGAAYCVVVDYKSGRKTIDPILLANGVQMQLPAYLAVLRQLADPRPVFGVGRLIPVGVFYVNLRGSYGPGHHRREVLDELQQTRLAAYQHRGRFCLEALPWLDSMSASQGSSGQFSYASSRKVHGHFRDPLPSAEFNALLDLVERQLRDFGARILAGAAQVDPYRKGATEVACQHCDYRPICRIDPWTHEYRQLRRPGVGAA